MDKEEKTVVAVGVILGALAIAGAIFGVDSCIKNRNKKEENIIYNQKLSVKIKELVKNNNTKEIGFVLKTYETHDKWVHSFDVRIIESDDPERLKIVSHWHAVECVVLDELDPKRIELTKQE